MIVPGVFERYVVPIGVLVAYTFLYLPIVFRLYKYAIA